MADTATDLPPTSPTIRETQSVDDATSKSKMPAPPKMSTFKSARTLRSGKKNGSKNKNKRGRRGQTNTFMAQVNVGQTVRLSRNRIAFVKFKGRVKFGIGIWYGLEIYDALTQTRHNGTVFGKRYFNCPRRKGLFTSRDTILEVIKPQNIKKALRDLDKKQIKRQKLEAKNKAAMMAAESRNRFAESKSQRRSKPSALAMYAQPQKKIDIAPSSDNSQISQIHK